MRILTLLGRSKSSIKIKSNFKQIVLIVWRFLYRFYGKVNLIFRDKKQKRILITGCGRSGTKYIANTLTKMGLPIGHEKMSKFGVAAWPLAVDSSVPAWFMLFNRRDYNFNLILHQVRNPLDAIKSMYTFVEASWSYIEKFIPIQRSDVLTLKCMKYWYYWNLKAEEISDWTYRIEDLSVNFKAFCQKIKHLELIKKKNILDETNKNINTRRKVYKDYKQIKWVTLEKIDFNLCLKIKYLAKKYGYKV